VLKGEKSIRGEVEDFLCPFTDMYITQGSNSPYSHKGIMANDVRGIKEGVKYPYYAPCTCKCLKTYPESGQVMWQSLNKVRFANGRIDYATFMTAHDETMDAKINQIVSQGEQLGNMGIKGHATGVHCHIEVSQSNDTTWTKNQYGNYHFNNEYDLDDCYFVDHTNILYGMGGNWKTTAKVLVTNSNNKTGKNYINLHPEIDKWLVYPLDKIPSKKNAITFINPKKYGGLSYYIYAYHDNNATAEINTEHYGHVKIWIKNTDSDITIDRARYEHGNY